jgi:protein-disulfide isomerase
MTRASQAALAAMCAIVIGGLVACSPASAPATPSAEAAPVAISPYLGETVLGDPAAPVEVIEYASTTCGHCAAFHALVIPELKSRYIDTGKAKLVYRVLPTAPGAVSAAGAAIARCAGEDRFFAVIDDLYASQEQILRAARSEETARAALVEVAERHGLSAGQARACMSDPGIAQQLEASLQDLPEFVNSTPTLIVDGAEVEEPSPENLFAAIEAAHAAAAADVD